jgi:hypothetical protein
MKTFAFICQSINSIPWLSLFSACLCKAASIQIRRYFGDLMEVFNSRKILVQLEFALENGMFAGWLPSTNGRNSKT